jgi:hypothetical protein
VTDDDDDDDDDISIYEKNEVGHELQLKKSYYKNSCEFRTCLE